MFDTSAAARVSYQTTICFSTSADLCLCATWGNTNRRNCVFSLECCILLYQQTLKHVQIITWLQLLLVRYFSQGRIKHLVGPTHFTMPGPQSLC